VDAALLRKGFNAEWYLRAYPDVALSGVNPWMHFLRRGAKEGRNPGPWLDSQWYVASDPGLAASHTTALRHFSERGLSEGRAPHRAVVGQPLWNRVLRASPSCRKPSIRGCSTRPGRRFRWTARAGQGFWPIA
jgi:hypothetical protein